jgi:hypothetical protein
MPCKVHLFDFDGTLTTRDTLLAFISHACGAGRGAGRSLCAPAVSCGSSTQLPAKQVSSFH